MQKWARKQQHCKQQNLSVFHKMYIIAWCAWNKTQSEATNRALNHLQFIQLFVYSLLEWLIINLLQKSNCNT